MTGTRIKVFFSYSHRDEEYRHELETHLAALQRQGVISTWHDRRIAAGGHVDHEISEHLESAHVILLMVSAYFLASDYCYDIEMQRALQRHEAGTAVVIPVIVHPCDWQNAPFGKLRATPADGKPLSKFANIHDGLHQVTKDIRAVADRLSPDETPRVSVPASRPSASTRIAQDVRSSNLRVKKVFSDHERDQFRDQSFEYMANFFEESLSELARRESDMTVRFRRVDANHFTAAVYRRGEKVSSCRVWLGGPLVGDIAYAGGDSGPDNSWNATLSVTDDGYSLGLSSTGLQIWGSREGSLSQHGAAEHFWGMLMGPLQ